MWYFISILMGMVAGALCAFLALEAMRKRLDAIKRKQTANAQKLLTTLEEIKEREQVGLRALKAKEQQSTDAIATRHDELEKMATRLRAEHEEREHLSKGIIEAGERDLAELRERLKTEYSEFKAKAVSYDELRAENAILKQDLQNLDVGVHKLRLDGEQRRQVQEKLDQLAKDLGSRYLKENVKWIGDSLTPNNYASCKQRLQDVIERCRTIGFAISAEDESGLLADLKAEYEMVVRADFQREEQARIKARIREEQALEREVERELQQLEREREAIQVALEKALADAKDEHSDEVESLKVRLAEAEAKAQRTKSQAQLTKSGHIYVISNIGSFGEGIYKIGMTRRLEPIDRIKELGDASVPFPFDIHMMISSDDAPTLENAIHRMLHKMRINKANPRKEFFRTDIAAICDIVKKHHGEVQYIADAEALQYRQSVAMSDEDGEYIEHVYDSLEDDGEAANAVT